MYLKSLELQGFKSFPDKIKLDFDKGLTAVVGPNGSGKSNIGDAVRWVLGEQSTKTLRGNKMEDVIFSGTMTRKPVGYASVTLNIDNSERGLSVDNDEVAITRKLYRSGDSEYLINGRNVRLKDINELFMDTGLGRDGYSIVGQGRIAEIVGAKSNDRRDIFEEAAGISKFRYKKAEAERKLAKAQENIIRLNDIVVELEVRVEPLRIQSEKAEKFLVLADKKKRLEISVFLNRLDELRVEIKKIHEDILICDAQYDNVENEIAQGEEKIRQGYRKVQETSAEIERIRAKTVEIEKKSLEYMSDIAVFENDILHSKNTIDAIKLKQNDEQNSVIDINERTEAQQQLLKESLEKQSKIIDEIKEVSEQFADIEIEVEDVSKLFDDAENKLNSLYIKQGEYRVNINSLEATVKDMDEQINNESAKKNELQAELSNYDTEIKSLKEDMDRLEAVEQEQVNKIDGYMSLYQQKLKKLENEKKEYEQAMLRLKEKQQRVKLLIDLENSMEGFAVSVKEIIRLSRSSSIKGIHGTIAQLIKTEDKYITAIETALGGALQNIVVDDESIAKRCIKLLKERKAGRATFLPITSVKGYTFNKGNLSDEAGFIAMANEIITINPTYNGIINSLLGRIVIADNIDSATFIAKKYGYKFRIVTLDGQVINVGGSFTGGSAVRSSGVLTRKNDINKLNDDIIDLTASQRHLEKNVDKLRNDTIRLANCIEHEKDEKVSIAEDIIRFQSEYTRLISMQKQMNAQLENTIKQTNSLANKRDYYVGLIEKLTNELKAINSKITILEKDISSQQGRHKSLQGQRKEFIEKLSLLKISQMEISKDREAIEREIAILKQNRIEADSRCEQALAEIVMQERVITEKKSCIEERKNLVEQVKQEVLDNSKRLDALRVMRDEYEKSITEIRSGMKAVNSEREKLLQEKSRLDERQVSKQKDYDRIITQLWEDYELSRSEAQNFSEKITDMVAAKRELNELKNKIRALGNINVSAIEEYKEVSERYEFLSEQLDDVEASKRELERLIEDLTQEMQHIFLDSFNKINEEFKRIFVELFGGGKAKLVLSEPENILESGIEIVVAPPGKVIKNLISLSGGEQAFVAIAIYFAILTVKPAPFCILDEIDAALDEVNVLKYAQYLKNFVTTTQFILITHRRGSMESANILYGVTMQEDGVSKLLKLEQVDFLVDK
ncbi:MAG: chromosome segregation protein SMC [Clostridiales bacterium]|nr:chromosome segregation protein SMC [Clostridiales bacterium]